MSANQTIPGDHLQPRTVKRCVRWPELQQMLGVSRFTVWRWMKDGRFPKSFALGPSTICWDADEVREWLTRQRDEARIQPAPTPDEVAA